MATPRLVTVREFNTSRFAQLADTSNTNVADVLARAEVAIESKVQRPLIPTTYTERYRPSSNIIYLRKRPVRSVTSVLRGLTPVSVNALVPSSQYYIDSDLGTIEFNGLVIGYVIDITYVAGFATTPEDIKEAILMQTALFIFQDLEIYGSGDAKEPGILYMKDDIDELLEPYKLLNIAYSR